MEINGSLLNPFNNPTEDKIKNVNKKIDKSNFIEKQIYCEEDLKDAKEIMDKLLKKHKSHIEYETYDKFKSVTIIKIVDTDTKEIIKEIPPKKLLDMVAKMCEMVGIMIDEKV
ncbi:flagellar protein FlaG [Hathewaya limosa]|uniref:Flagellar protein FlaG n=1 Tax=Hathewaya limosa TaxID=1536 RepID=A0ABU0JSL0_HATLI|nr:flagellar protein FlaG [Hathewaya limosa]MDQ0479231.1 flagellar protein FlaG [Hathewaya limosa]